LGPGSGPLSLLKNGNKKPPTSIKKLGVEHSTKINIVNYRKLKR